MTLIKTRRPFRITGFSMVEALVALVVLSVGMLGIASLYVTTLRSSGSAITRMQVIMLATDIGDRIRANRLARMGYNTASVAPQNNGCVGGAVLCTRAQMAAEDLWVWQNQLAAALPGATGTIAVVPGTMSNGQGMVDPSRYTITISWNEPNQTALLTHVLVLDV